MHIYITNDSWQGPISAHWSFDEAKRKATSLAENYHRKSDISLTEKGAVLTQGESQRVIRSFLVIKVPFNSSPLTSLAEQLE